MEFLFTNQWAQVEALIFFCCLLLLGVIFGYELYLYLRQVWIVFFPKRPPLEVEKNTPLSEESIAPVIWLDAIEPLPESTELPEIILDNPVLYTEEWAPITPEASLIEDTPIHEISPLIEESIAPDDTDALWHEPPIQPDTPLETVTELPPVLDIPPTVVSMLTSEEGDTSPPSGSNSLEEPIIPETPLTPIVPVENLPESTEKESKKSHRAHSEKKEHIDHKTTKKPHTISPAKREKLAEIIANVRTLIARWHVDDARTLIVSGLAIEKNNRELNIIMASIYEREHAFEKAELILKDIALEYPEDIDILTHLATDLAMQHKYEVSYELYKKILAIGWEKEDILYTLTHLASEMQRQDDAIEYARSYLKQYPHNPEILWLYSQAQISTWMRRDAVETLIKLKNLTPYNQEIADLIQKLVTEEELAGNFWWEKA